MMMMMMMGTTMMVIIMIMMIDISSSFTGNNDNDCDGHARGIDNVDENEMITMSLNIIGQSFSFLCCPKSLQSCQSKL